MVNGNPLQAEVCASDGYISLQVDNNEIDLDNIGISSQFTLNQGNEYDDISTYHHPVVLNWENWSIVGQSDAPIKRGRSDRCCKVLSFCAKKQTCVPCKTGMYLAKYKMSKVKPNVRPDVDHDASRQ